MSPFRNILWLSAGDFIAKTLNFLVFVYLARVLGVTAFGTLEFALSIMTYFLLLSDGGLDLWATREVAKGASVRELISRVLPLRIALALLACILLFILFPFMPAYPKIDKIMIFLALSILIQALNLKWIFLGMERMRWVGFGFLLTQIILSGLVFGLVRDSSQVFWVAGFILIAELVAVIYYSVLYIKSNIGRPVAISFRGSRQILLPALTIGAVSALGIVAYNFDTILLGFIKGPEQVGWYRAAYKPITAALALPLTYFLGLFPALSRTYVDNNIEFTQVISRSLRIAMIFALPLGIGGVFFAPAIIGLLYGSEYDQSILVLQVLSWSAVLVIMRGTFRQSLVAAGKQKLDLGSGTAAVALNVTLNLVFIWQYGMIGAAVATVLADLVWLIFVHFFFNRSIMKINILDFLKRPLFAAVVMGAGLYLLLPIIWPLRAVLGIAIYFLTLLLTGEKEVRSWMRGLRMIESR